MHIVKSVFQYLKKTILLKLIYRKDTAHPMESYKPNDIIRYADSNYASNPKDWKSIMGYYFFMNRAIIIWSSKKQCIVLTSTIKAEYIKLEHEIYKNV